MNVLVLGSSIPLINFPRFLCHCKVAMGWSLDNTVASGCMHGDNTRRAGETTRPLLLIALQGAYNPSIVCLWINRRADIESCCAMPTVDAAVYAPRGILKEVAEVQKSCSEDHSR
jgi:hypothetical protein